MSFTLELSDTYFTPVSLRVPVEAVQKTFSFEVELRRLSTSQHDQLLKRAMDEQMTDAQVARALVVGWREVRGADGAELPFSEAAFSRLLEVQGAGTAICDAYLGSVKQAAEKNFRRLP